MSESDSNQAVSVVIRTYNRSALLTKTLISLFQQSYPANKWEIVVVDNASTDDTREVIRRFENKEPTVRYVYEQTLGAARARDAGMRAARGQIISWIDDDCVADPRWLESMVATFEETEPKPAMVGGEIELEWEDTRPRWLPPELEHALGRLHFGDAPCQVRAVNGANMAWRAEIGALLKIQTQGLGPVGRSKSRTSEDTDLSFQLRALGEPLWFTPNAIVRHFVPREYGTVSYVMSRYFAYGISGSRRYQVYYPDDRIDSAKRMGKAVLRLSSLIITALLQLPKRAGRPHRVLIDLAPILERVGFLIEESRFQISLLFRARSIETDQSSRGST